MNSSTSALLVSINFIFYKFYRFLPLRVVLAEEIEECASEVFELSVKLAAYMRQTLDRIGESGISDSRPYRGFLLLLLLLLLL